MGSLSNCLTLRIDANYNSKTSVSALYSCDLVVGIETSSAVNHHTMITSIGYD